MKDFDRKGVAKQNQCLRIMKLVGRINILGVGVNTELLTQRCTEALMTSVHRRFTDIDRSVMSVNVGAPVSSVPQCTSVSVMPVVSKLTPHIPNSIQKKG